MTAASAAVAAYTGTEPAERSKLELERDEELRRLQAEEKRYQIVGDLEADIKKGLIAISSPVARAMIG